MLILAIVFLTSGAGFYLVGNFISNPALLFACATMCVLLEVAGTGVLLFELMIMPWRKHGCDLTILDVVRDVKRKVFKL